MSVMWVAIFPLTGSAQTHTIPGCCPRCRVSIRFSPSWHGSWRFSARCRIRPHKIITLRPDRQGCVLLSGSWPSNWPHAPRHRVSPPIKIADICFQDAGRYLSCSCQSHGPHRYKSPWYDLLPNTWPAEQRYQSCLRSRAISLPAAVRITIAIMGQAFRVHSE